MNEQETGKYEVLFPHARSINGQLMMFEPMFSGIVTLPDDDETKAAVERGWLQRVTETHREVAPGVWLHK